MIEAFVIAILLVLFRVTAFVAFMPPMFGQGLPTTVRLGLATALTVLLIDRHAFPAAMLLISGHTGTALWVKLAWLTARETALGAGLAWMFTLCLVPVRVAGAWIGQEMGLTMGGLTSPMDQQPSNVISQMLEAVAVLLFFALDLHHLVFWALGRSFHVQPVATAWRFPAWEKVTQTVGGAIDSGFLMIAPVGILLFVLVITLLVTMRTAPQFNFMSYGMAMRVLVGLVGLTLFLPDICGAIQQVLYRVGSVVAG